MVSSGRVCGAATIGLGILLGCLRDIAAEEKAAATGGRRYVPVKLDEAEAVKLQSDWAAKLGTTREMKTATGITMVLIPPAGETIPRPYWMGKYEVMQREWQAVEGAGHATKEQGKDAESDRQPVRLVSWLDCILFCNRLSEQEGFKPYYALTNAEKRPGQDAIITAKIEILGGDGYRLPLPVEMEHAVRAGTITSFFFGDVSKVDDYGWHESNSGNRLHDAGEKLPNPWGLHDVYGNVREWVEECEVAEQTRMVGRAKCCGGSFHYKPFVSGEGRWHNAADRLGFVGMRLARNAAPAAAK